jgi:hypothetical protein
MVFLLRENASDVAVVMYGLMPGGGENLKLVRTSRAIFQSEPLFKTFTVVRTKVLLNADSPSGHLGVLAARDDRQSDAVGSPSRDFSKSLTDLEACAFWRHPPSCVAHLTGTCSSLPRAN